MLVECDVARLEVTPLFTFAHVRAADTFWNQNGLNSDKFLVSKR